MERRTQPGDTEAAWDALFEVVPVGWQVAQPQFDMACRMWMVSAVDVRGAWRTGHMPLVVSATAPNQPSVLVELARCLVVAARGDVPR